MTSIVAQGPFTAMRADPIVVAGEEPADDSSGLSGGIIAVIGYKTGCTTVAPDAAPLPKTPTALKHVPHVLR